MLFGRGSTGGAINQVSKAPLLTPFEDVSTEFGTNDLYRATADLDTPISQTAAVRLNLMGQSSAVAERDDVRNRRWGVAPAVAFGFGDQDSLILAYLHQQEDDVSDTGIPFVDGRVAPVPRDAFFGLASDSATTDDDILTARYRHDFSDNVSLDNTARYAHYEFDYQFDSPNFGDNTPDRGDAARRHSGRPGRPGQLRRADQSGRSARSDRALRHRLHCPHAGDRHRDRAPDLGSRSLSEPLQHEQQLDSARLRSWTRTRTSLGPAEPVASRQDTTAPSGGAYVHRHAGLGQYVSLTGGFRYDDFSASYNSLTVQTGALLRLHELNRLGSPRASLVIKPTPRQTYYFSYGTSFDPSAEALTLTTKTADLGPVKAKSFEVGAKSQWLDGRLMLTQALFRTEVDNAQTNDPDNPTITVLNGNERVDGRGACRPSAV